MINGLDKYTIVIPARRNSKGVPFKNRKLIHHTLSSLPVCVNSKVVIATDDEEIASRFSGYRIFNRSESVSTDEASTKSLLVEMLEKEKTIETENIIVLYTTYPEREFKDIIAAVRFFEKLNAPSLLCAKELGVSPFLTMFKKGHHGEQTIKHSKYRRQDYPECFELSHFVSVFKRSEIHKLGENLYNAETVFYPIDNVIDIDTEADMGRFYENKNNS